MEDILICDTLTDMIEKLKLDKNHWINIEAMKFIDDKSYNNLKIDLFHYPQELKEKKLVCQNGHTFIPNWLEKRYPYTVFYKENRIFRIEGCNIKCHSCDGNSDFKIDFKNYKTDLDVFGDEALELMLIKKV